MKFTINTVDFEIVKQIAEGGMGTVYLAKQKGVEGFEKTVAIKTMLDNYSNDPIFVEKFIWEAKLVANLVHENIVQLYQLAKFNETYFFVLEFVNGLSLNDLHSFHVKQNKLLPRELSVWLISRIARGLAYAHSRTDHKGQPLEIAHCDVCPHNILITKEGLPKLTDFGIAKASTFTDEDMLSGKLPYMSPEQASQKDVDYRSDIYSLGIVLFQLLSGYTTRTLTEPMFKILNSARDGIVNWENMPDDIDNDLMLILRRMLEKSPEARYQSTDELGRDLEYHIYKDGYGPTIVTMSNYLSEQMPYLFINDDSVAEKETIIDKTTVLPQSSQLENKSSYSMEAPLDKTVKMNFPNE